MRFLARWFWLVLVVAGLLGCEGRDELLPAAPTPATMPLGTPLAVATRPLPDAAPVAIAETPRNAPLPEATLPPTPLIVGTAPSGMPAAAPPEAHNLILHPDIPAPDLSLLPHYVISATLEPPVLQGRLFLTLPNSGSEPLPDVVLRLYGNAPTIYTGSRMEVSNVQVAGQGAAAQLEAAGTALRILLPEPLPPSERVTIAVDFKTTVATESFRGYGIQQVSRGVAVFGSPFPLLALRDGITWRVPIVPTVGDAASSPTALWDLFVRVPDSFTLVSTGEALPTEAGESHIVTGPARDMALVALPNTVRPFEGVFSGVRVRYWPADYVGSANFPAADAAAVAGRAVSAFVTEFGPPPYAQLDIIEAPVPIGGYEYPGLVLFDGEQRSLSNRDGIDFLVPHEVAHQWFYAMVGNDVTREPWIDEGLATFAQLRYLNRVRGPEAAATQRRRWEVEYAMPLARRPVGVNRPLFGYSDWVTYRGPTYYASALLFDDLRQQMGDALFSEALRRFIARHAFTEATTDDVRATFDEVAAANGISLNEFWSLWLE